MNQYIGTVSQCTFQLMYTKKKKEWSIFYAGGGNSKICLFSPRIPGEIIQFDYSMFQMD